jgi:hypothetical protein
MSRDQYLLIGVWVVSFLLIFTIPRDKFRLALVSFLFKQMITSVVGHVVVEYGLLAYPVTELADINRTSFTYEFLAYPIICAIFNVYYPFNRSRLYQVGYYIVFATALTIPEVLIERYTELIRYVRWNWFWTWGTLFITFLMTRVFCVAFFKTIQDAYANPE